MNCSRYFRLRPSSTPRRLRQLGLLVFFLSAEVKCYSAPDGIVEIREQKIEQSDPNLQYLQDNNEIARFLNSDCDPDQCLTRCTDKYGGSLLSGLSYFCAKGCAAVSGGKIVVKDHFCTYGLSERYPHCEEACAGSSNDASNRAACKYACEHWELDFTISSPSPKFIDDNGLFSIEMNYTVGKTADDLKVTLMNQNCTDIDNSVANTIQLGHEKIYPQIFSKQILIFKQNFIGSSLVSQLNEETGLSAGSLNFCVKAEAFLSTTSVTFIKSNIKLNFDLTKNDFKVENNEIIENNIVLTEKNVTSNYGVEAFRCTKDSYARSSSPELTQNALVYICLEPDSVSSSVRIVNFEMKFDQDSITKYTVVNFGVGEPTPNAGLSSIQVEGDTFRVVSRLVTILFERNSFNVTGNAFLAFKSDRKLDVLNASTSGLRLLQDSSNEDAAGNAEFNMNIKLLKAQTSDVATQTSRNKNLIAICFVGGVAIFAIAFALFKKK